MNCIKPVVGSPYVQSPTPVIFIPVRTSSTKWPKKWTVVLLEVKDVRSYFVFPLLLSASTNNRTQNPLSSLQDVQMSFAKSQPLWLPQWPLRWVGRSAVHTFPFCKMLLLDVLIVHMEAPQEVVVLGDGRAVRQDVPESRGEAACRSEHACSHLMGLLRQVRLFL